jgi:hypothetical protein
MSWLKSWEDPDVMEAELERYFPKAVQALRARFIDQAIEEEDAAANPNHKDSLAKARKADLAERQRRIDEKITKARDDRKAVAIQSAKLRDDYIGWTKEAMESAGLNFDSEKHRTAFTDRIMSPSHSKGAWTRETFSGAAKHVADLLGLKAKKPAAKAGEKPADKPAAKLPPIAKSGAKPPASRTPAPKRRSILSTDEGFSALRKKHGLF